MYSASEEWSNYIQFRIYRLSGVFSFWGVWIVDPKREKTSGFVFPTILLKGFAQLLFRHFHTFHHTSMGTRLDSPTLYQWDLDENSTRYEYPRARPEDNVLQIQFSILAFINAVVAVSSLVLIIAILKSKQVRSSAFNLYLLFMAIPDFIGSFLCLLTCAMSAPGSDYYSEAMCGFQGFYLVFAFCGNAWINAVIVHEVNKLLNYSQKRRRYFPPTRRRVLCHVAAVYTYAAFWGLLTAFPILGMPFQTKAYYGFACFPMEQDTASTWFFYFAFLPGILMIPMLYSVFVMGRIILKGLLPTAGKRRALSLFLMRLIVVYFLGWLPFMIFSVSRLTSKSWWQRLFFNVDFLFL